MVAIICHATRSKKNGLITQVLITTFVEKKPKVLKGPCCESDAKTIHRDGKCLASILEKDACNFTGSIAEWLDDATSIVCVDEDTLRIFRAGNYNTPKKFHLYRDIFGHLPSIGAMAFKPENLARLVKLARNSVWKEANWTRIAAAAHEPTTRLLPKLKIRMKRVGGKRFPTKGEKKFCYSVDNDASVSDTSLDEVKAVVEVKEETLQKKEKIIAKIPDPKPVPPTAMAMAMFSPISEEESDCVLKQYGLFGIDADPMLPPPIDDLMFDEDFAFPGPSAPEAVPVTNPQVAMAPGWDDALIFSELLNIPSSPSWYQHEFGGGF